MLMTDPYWTNIVVVKLDSFTNRIGKFELSFSDQTKVNYRIGEFELFLWTRLVGKTILDWIIVWDWIVLD